MVEDFVGKTSRPVLSLSTTCILLRLASPASHQTSAIGAQKRDRGPHRTTNVGCAQSSVVICRPRAFSGWMNVCMFLLSNVRTRQKQMMYISPLGGSSLLQSRGSVWNSGLGFRVVLQG